MLSCWRRLLLRYFTETESSNSIIFCCKLQFLINYQMWYSFSTLPVYQRVIRNRSGTHISLPVLWLTCSYSSVVCPILWTFIVENSNLIWIKIKYVRRLSLIILKDNSFYLCFIFYAYEYLFIKWSFFFVRKLQSLHILYLNLFRMYAV